MGFVGRSSSPSSARFSISEWNDSLRVSVEDRSSPSQRNPPEKVRSICAFGPIAKLKRSNAAAPNTNTAMSWPRVRHWRRSSLRRAAVMGASSGAVAGCWL
jgi:hypothetical protein